MKRESNNILSIEKVNKTAKASFRNTNKLTLLNSEALRLELLELVTEKNVNLEINLLGIKFIDSSTFDIFNLTSRVAKRYGSSVFISFVEPELMELIELVKLHSVFDIRRIIPHAPHQNVA